MERGLENILVETVSLLNCVSVMLIANATSQHADCDGNERLINLNGAAILIEVLTDVFQRRREGALFCSVLIIGNFIHISFFFFFY